MIQEFETSDEILDFAISREQDSVNLYLRLSEMTQNPEMKNVFLTFSNEEKAHKKRLENIKSSGQFKFTPQQVKNLKIGDYLVDIEPHEKMTYQEVLIVAMKKEKTAFHLYNDLASSVEDQLLSSLFESLAQEEAKHKLRFEIAYDDFILGDN